ncbi:MAG: peptidase S8, partial [Pedobacter sp.]
MKFNKIIAFLIFVTIGFQASGQDKTVKLPPNWYNLDFKKDGFFGISTEKAYSELLKGKQPKQKVIVAVIDGGTDVRHEDLKDVLWTNIKEIPGNGIDDDNNGYIDDVHGWNFIGSSKGNLAYDNLELVRIIRKLRPKYQSTLPSTRLDSAQKEEYELYQRATQEFGKKYDDAQRTMQYLEYITQLMDSVALQNKKTVPTMQDIENYKPDSEIESQILTIIKKESKNSGGFEKFYKEMKKGYKDYKVMLQYNLNPGYDERAQLVGDNYANSNERIYGNNDVAGPDADHGTHVSGIIGANRTNNIGINGIANSVLIMSIRVVPQGDERDKDVANGIRYAVDNGARVINMSFGKGFKWDKK